MQDVSAVKHPEDTVMVLPPVYPEEGMVLAASSDLILSHPD